MSRSQARAETTFGTHGLPGNAGYQTGSPMNTRTPELQRTLARSVRSIGLGLHTGKPVTLSLRPGRPDTGIVFVRTDAATGARLIRAHWRQVESTQLCTVVGNPDGLAVGTIEHLMAALRGSDVDNAMVELDGPEVPIMDGSAAPLVDLISRAGLVRQSAPRRFIEIRKLIEVREGDKFARLEPGPVAEFTVGIDFPSAAIGRQNYSIVLDRASFERELAPARTFGFIEQLAPLRDRGLTLGGSLNNAIVVDGDQILNADGLRFPDEFVRHKLLDSIGDLYLAGRAIIGHYKAYKPGHALNAALIERLFADTEAWSLVTSGDTASTGASSLEAMALAG